jgi:hypothetical protein
MRRMQAKGRAVASQGSRMKESVRRVEGPQPSRWAGRIFNEEAGRQAGRQAGSWLAARHTCSIESTTAAAFLLVADT